MSGRKRWVAAAVVVLVGGAGTAAWAVTRSSGSASAATATTQLVAATSSTEQTTVSSSGTIEPASDEDLSFSVSGTITKVSATVGQKVAKGAVLAKVDTTDLQSAVDTAQAAVTAAEEQVTAVASDSSTQQASAAAQLASAETSLTTAKTALANASLKAPFAGTVAAVSMAVGDVVGSSGGGGGGGGATGSSTSSSDTITLISTDSWIVNASVGSADLAQLTKGMQVQVTPSGATTKVFGTVASIGIVASSSSSGSATFPVVVAVTGSPTGLYAGASATLSFIVKSVDDVLTVPTLALHTSGTTTTVNKSVNGKVVSTPVTVGTSYGATTQILSGLVAGDKVEVTFGAPGGGGTTRRTGTTGGGTGATTGGGFGGGAFPGGGAGFPGGNG